MCPIPCTWSRTWWLSFIAGSWPRSPTAPPTGAAAANYPVGILTSRSSTATHSKARQLRLRAFFVSAVAPSYPFSPSFTGRRVTPEACFQHDMRGGGIRKPQNKLPPLTLPSPRARGEGKFGASACPHSKSQKAGGSGRVSLPVGVWGESPIAPAARSHLGKFGASGANYSPRQRVQPFARSSHAGQVPQP